MIPRKKNCHEDLVLLLLEREREREIGGGKKKVTQQQQIRNAVKPSSPNTDRSLIPHSSRAGYIPQTMLQAAIEEISALTPAIPELSFQEFMPLIEQDLSSLEGQTLREEWRELPFITASRSHLASARGKRRFLHPARPARPRQCRRAAAGRLRLPEDGAGSPRRLHPDQLLLRGARVKTQFSGDKRPITEVCVYFAHTFCQIPRHLLCKPGAQESPVGTIRINPTQPSGGLSERWGEILLGSWLIQIIFQQFSAPFQGRVLLPQASTHLLSQHKACKRKGKACTHGPGLHDMPVLCDLASLAPSFLLLSFPKASKQPGGYKERSPGETNKFPVLSPKTSHQGNKTLTLKQQFCDCFLSHKISLLYCVNPKQSPQGTQFPKGMSSGVQETWIRTWLWAWACPSVCP